MLRTDYTDDVLDTSKNTERVYNIKDKDGRIIEEEVKFEDVTDYSSQGSVFGAGDINATNTEVNRLNESLNNIEKEISDGMGQKIDDIYKSIVLKQEWISCEDPTILQQQNNTINLNLDVNKIYVIISGFTEYSTGIPKVVSGANTIYRSPVLKGKYFKNTWIQVIEPSNSTVEFNVAGTSQSDVIILPIFNKPTE